MSTIITFSARSFSEAWSAWAWARSSACVLPRAAVPFMGRHWMRVPSSRKNSSGEALQITHSPVSRKAP